MFCFLLKVNLPVHAVPGDQQMKTRLVDNERIKRASLYITAAALCLLILCVFLQIWRADLRVPFYYGGDAALFAMQLDETLQGASFMKRSDLRLPKEFDRPKFITLGGCVALAVARRRGRAR